MRLLAAMIAGACPLMAAAPASAYISVYAPGSAAGSQDGRVTEDTPFTLIIDYAGEGNQAHRLVVKIKPQAAGPCAATPDDDPGRPMLEDSVVGDGRREIGDSEGQPGDLLACAWLADSGRPTGYEGPAERRVAVLPAVARLELGLAAGAVALRGMPVPVGFNVSAAAGRRLAVGFGAAPVGSKCPERSGASRLVPLFPGGLELTPEIDGGVRLARAPHPGRYLVCGWVEEPGDAVPEATATFAVRVPARRTQTVTEMVALGPARRGRRVAWVTVKADAMRLDVEHGTLRMSWSRTFRMRRRHRRSISPERRDTTSACAAIRTSACCASRSAARPAPT